MLFQFITTQVTLCSFWATLYVCTKILSKLCSCIYEIQNFVEGKRKKCVLYFHILLQFIGFAPGPNLGTSALPHNESPEV